MNEKSAAYTCPMHPEIIRSSPGACPICGMGLVPLLPSGDGDDQEFTDLQGKMKIAALFTIPVALLSMAGMHTSGWNRVQLAFSLPVIYVCRSFFLRAWRSVATWNLNMFTLVGLGTSIAFLFSLAGMFLPGMFPTEFKTHNGSVALYFEATTVILSLVLLGQLLEAMAHSRTNGAIRALLQLAPREATLVAAGKDEVIAIDRIVKGNLLRVKPGEKIPVDGYITEGAAEGHKCKNLHGHTYQLTRYVAGTIKEREGWLMDYGDLKAVAGPVIERLDHHLLNEIAGLENPTVEVLSIWIWNNIKPLLPQLTRIELKETPSSGVIYEGD